jgi:hypothetical protein
MRTSDNNQNVFILILNPQNIGIDTSFINLHGQGAEIYQKTRFSIMAAPN